jgi:cytoskeletal protein CcmA (bactofilin family)
MSLRPTFPDTQVSSETASTFLSLPCFRVSPMVIAGRPSGPNPSKSGKRNLIMSINQTQTEPHTSPPSQWSKSPSASFNATSPGNPNITSTRSVACLGATLTIKGEITSDEDLQIDGKVQGSISLPSKRLTLGRTAELNSEITAGEVIVYGKVTGNLAARDRVEIKKDGSVIGDIATARISIEDGAYFKGRIEIDRPKSQIDADSERVQIPATA